MPRLPRLFIKDALYYITCRAEVNQKIFEDEKDYAMFLELLKKYKEQYGIKIFSYALMPGHLHLLVEMTRQIDTGQSQDNSSLEISDFMHNLNNSYTKYFNSRYERKGHLFRERFKGVIVEKEPYLVKMTAYIHLNPKRLNMAIELKDYPYSSYSLYLYNKGLKDKAIDLSQEVDEVLSLLGNRDYAEFVSGMSAEVSSLLHKNLQRGGILGSESFIKQVKSQVKTYQEKSESAPANAPAKKYKFVVTASGLLLVFMAGAGGVYFYAMNRRPKQTAVTQPASAQAPQAGEEKKVKTYNIEEWDVRLLPTAGGKELADTLRFHNGKFISTTLTSKGFPDSNYSVAIENGGKVIWETMQSSPNGIASWRGEIAENKMTGILSLRQKGQAPQDFSFISTNYRRKE